MDTLDDAATAARTARVDGPRRALQDEAPGRSLGRRLGDITLNVAAFLGAVAIALLIASVVFGVSIIMFRTGSMGPTIPAGSVAFVQELPAARMEVGDVVTVSRGEHVLPVTHRVVNIIATDPNTGVVTFEMRGDANHSADAQPYTASTVQRVLFSVPGIAPALQWFNHPLVLGSLTVAASGLVVWAFWPRRGDDEDTPARRAAPPGEHPRGDAVDPAHRSTAVGLRARHGAESVRFTRGLRSTVTPVVSALLALALPATAAAAPPGDTDHLHMVTEGDHHAMRNLSPGSSVTLTVGVWAEAPEPGEITLAISAHQPPTMRGDALRIVVTMCSSPWVEGACPGELWVAMDETAAGDLPSPVDGPLDLAVFHSDEQRWLHVTVTLAEDVTRDEATGLQATVLVHATGVGERIVSPLEPPKPGPADPGPGLPNTGVASHPEMLP